MSEDDKDDPDLDDLAAVALRKAGDALEQAVNAGHVNLAGALRHVEAAFTAVDERAIVHREDVAHEIYDGGKLLRMITLVAEAIPWITSALIEPQSSANAALERYRSLCADLLELPMDGNIANHLDTLRMLKDEARSLLTGEQSKLVS